MVGNEYWVRTEYTKIQPVDFYYALDAFGDREDDLNTD